MPIVSRQFMMVLSTQFHTYTHNNIKENTCTKISKYCSLATSISDSLKSITKGTRCIKTVGDRLWVANKQQNTILIHFMSTTC